MLRTEKSGSDLIITFNGKGNGIPDDEFAAKLLGKTNDGKLLFGYARLPWVNFIEPILSARLPVITPNNNGFNLKVEVQNFGQVASKNTSLEIMVIKDQKNVEVASAKIPGLKSFQKTNIELKCGRLFDKDVAYDFVGTYEGVYSRNLAGDMMAIEGFAWDFTDSLSLNKIYRIPVNGEFAMADIGTDG